MVGTSFRAVAGRGTRVAARPGPVVGVATVRLSAAGGAAVESLSNHYQIIQPGAVGSGQSVADSAGDYQSAGLAASASRGAAQEFSPRRKPCGYCLPPLRGSTTGTNAHTASTGHPSASLLSNCVPFVLLAAIQIEGVAREYR